MLSSSWSPEGLAVTTENPRTMQLEMELWREACRHIEIDAFVESVAPALVALTKADYVLVRRIDAAGARLRTVATASVRNAHAPEHAQTPLSVRGVEELLQVCKNGDVLAGKVRDAVDVGRYLVPEGLGGAYAAIGLTSEEGTEGLIVLVRRSGAPFDAETLALLPRLVEPFSVALANDRRMHETTKLRAAAEADRQALLSRLNRSEISESVIGADAGLREVMERVEQVAPTDASVLILGETGSGKEVVARAIHARSRRKTGPIVRVNCGAIPPELIDSELFGHERGSFTGATGTRQGWFERADGGTLFLDEIGELPLAAQVRLLRVLQEGTLERVGGQRSISVDVRIVAATHRDLAAMVGRGEFREDLWYRISVFPIRLPALRERTGDVPMLAAHFAAKAGQRLGSGPIVPTADDIEVLRSYDWPGNVRELASVIERAAILGGGQRLDVRAALLGPSRLVPSASPPALPDEGSTGRSATSRTEPFPTLDEAMITHIERALARTNGVIEGPKGAARLLGVNPHTLRSRMRKHALDWQRFRDDSN